MPMAREVSLRGAATSRLLVRERDAEGWAAARRGA